MRKNRVCVQKRPSANTMSIAKNRLSFLLLSSILVVLVFSTVTYAWISKNDTVTYDKARMTLDVDKLKIGGVTVGDGVITLANGGDVFSGAASDNTLIPGSVLTLSIGIENEMGDKTVTGLGFLTPRIYTPADGDYDSINKSDYDEIPTCRDGVCYYLGTQLTVSADTYSIYRYTEDGVDEYGQKVLRITDTVVDRASLGASAPVYMTVIDGDTVSAPDIIRTFDTPISLGAGELIAFEITVTFVNDTEHDQNMYQNFGSADTLAKFTRSLAVITE